MKKFLCSLVAILAIFILVGCGGAGGDGGEKDDRLTITFWHAMGQEKRATIQKMIDSFEDKYPNVRVEQSSQGSYGDLLSKIGDTLKAGSGPVVAQTYPDHVISYLTSDDTVVDLNKYAFDPEVGFDALEVDPNNFVKSFWDEGYKYDDRGSLYSMPFNKSTEILLYNKTIFSKYDWFVQVLGYKPEDVYKGKMVNGVSDYSEKIIKDDFIWNPTWEEIIKIAEAYKLTPEYSAPEKDANDNDVKVQRYALGYDSEDNLFITVTQQMAALEETKTYGERGEDAFVRMNKTTNKGEFTFLDSNNPYPRKAVEWYNEQYKNHNFATASVFNKDYCTDYFKAERLIMTIGSTAGAGKNNPSGAFEVGVATYPQFEAAVDSQKQVIQQGTNLTLLQQKDKELEKYGWLFIVWMTNKENAELWSEETSYFPSRVDVFESQEYQDYLAGKKQTDSGVVLYEQTLENLAVIAGWQQKDWFYTNVVFNGTDKAREAGEGIVKSVINGTSMNKAFEDAAKALEKYIVK